MVEDEFAGFDAGHFLGGVKGIVEVAKFIDEADLQGLFAGEDAAIGGGVEFVGGDFGSGVFDEGAEGAVEVVDHVLEDLALFGCHFFEGGGDVFVLAAGDGGGIDTDAREQAVDGDELHNDADAAGDG